MPFKNSLSAANRLLVLFLAVLLGFLHLTCAVKRTQVHTIERGETLWEISRAYDVSLETILRINDIEDASSLSPGDKIRLPVSGGSVETIRKIAVGSKENEKNPVGQDPRSGRSAEDYPELPENGEQFEEDPEGLGFDPDWPVKGRLVSRFRPGGDPTKNGILIETPPDEKVKAAEAGEVRMAGLWDSLPELGKIIIVAHRDDFVTVYAHLDRTEVSTGDRVDKGEEIGVVGNTGVAEGNVCYFEIRYKLKPRDPLLFLGEPE